MLKSLADLLRSRVGSQTNADNTVIDARLCGLTDAVQSGWFLQDSDELLEGFKILSEDVVLEVGCGDGNATVFCADRGAHVIFSDIDGDRIKQVTARVIETDARGHTAIIGDTCPLPLDDETVTKVIAMEMLEHARDPCEVMRELVRVGKPGAQYLLTVPDSASEEFQKQFAPSGYFEEPNHINVFGREEFETMVVDAGLVVEKKVYYGFFWFMWMCMFWVTQRASGEQFEGAALDKIVPPYHPLLDSWTNTWDQLIKMPGGLEMKKAFDQLVPKSQAIIARKPT